MPFIDNLHMFICLPMCLYLSLTSIHIQIHPLLLSLYGPLPSAPNQETPALHKSMCLIIPVQQAGPQLPVIPTMCSASHTHLCLGPGAGAPTQGDRRDTGTRRGSFFSGQDGSCLPPLGRSPADCEQAPDRSSLALSMGP